MVTISEIHTKILSGESTARAEVEAAFERAEQASGYHALLSLTKERALERADQIDLRIKNGEDAGVLAGVPFVVKDNYLAFGAPTTAASRILEDFLAPLQATAVEKLEHAGAICIGKSNLDAFAHGGSTENSAFGVTNNAHDMTKVAGGSSGGSAVATALSIVPFALGTDTGGSIRQPASFNGIYGYKPTYGMVSRYGVVAMASSTDTIGCFATTAADTELVMQIMAGKDAKDHTTLDDYLETLTDMPHSLKIGLISESMTDDVDAEVRNRINEYVECLRTAGHTVDSVELPMSKYALAMYYIIVPAEVSSNLARYDGVRYGLRADGAKSLAELYGLSRDQGFMPENKRRIMIGSYVLSSGFYDAYFQQASKARTLLINQYNKLFSEYDVLLSPTAPTPAFGIGENVDDPVKMYLADIMTVPPSLAGLPALNVPAGKSSGGLPIGAQLIAPAKKDALLFALAKQMEDN